MELPEFTPNGWREFEGNGWVAIHAGETTHCQPMNPMSTFNPSKPAMARRLVLALQTASEGRQPPWWCSLSEIAKRAGADAEAAYHAVQQGWIRMSPGEHSIALTDAGWQLGAQ